MITLNVNPACIPSRARTLLVVLLIVLAGCAGRVEEDSAMPAGWMQHHDQHAALQSWRLAGRMAVQTAESGGSLDVFWSQQGEDFTIRLVAPMGKGAMMMRGNAGRVVARLANGEQVAGEPSALLADAFGVAVPVAELSWWLRGIASDSAYRNASWDSQGRLFKLSQQGWKVELREYQPAGDYVLPTRYYLEPVDGETSIRFVVRQWTPNP